MSALPPIADIGTQSRNVRFVPKADICSAVKFGLFDHVADNREQPGWYNRRPMTEPREFLFSAAYEDD